MEPKISKTLGVLTDAEIDFLIEELKAGGPMGYKDPRLELYRELQHLKYPHYLRWYKKD